MRGFTISDAAAACGGRISCASFENTELGRIVIDSRKVGPGDLFPLPLGQAIYITVMLIPEILGKIDDFQSGRTGMFCPESAAFPVTGAKEYHIHRVQRRIRAEMKIRITEQAGVDRPKRIAGIAGGLHEDDLRLGMIQQDTQQFACRVSRSPDDTDLDHSSFSNCSPSSLWLR